MHITIIAPGSRGDVRPYVALGRGLISSNLILNQLVEGSSPSVLLSGDFRTVIQSRWELNMLKNKFLI